MMRRAMRSLVTPRDNVTIEIYDAASVVLGPDGWPVRGRVLERLSGHNGVTTAGMNQIGARLAGNGGPSDSPITYFGIGTSSTAFAKSQTALVAEIHRAAMTRFVNTVDEQVTAQYFLSSSLCNGSNLREFGLFNAPASGVMHARYVRGSAIAKTSSLAIAFSWVLAYA